MKAQWRSSLSFAMLLNLLLPGAGHFLWREVLFGLFIFLIMLLAAALFIVHYLISMPAAATWLLLGLPLVFYAFSFVDLIRTVRTKRTGVPPTLVAATCILAVSVIYQLVSPAAPVNFGIRNFPEVSSVADSHLSPLYSKGDVLIANRLAYTADLPFLKQPVLHALPARFDLVRFVDESGHTRGGFVLGMPTEAVEVYDGSLTADDAPILVALPRGFALTGQWPLTTVEDYSILVGTFNFGTLEGLHTVRLDHVIGRVSWFDQ